MVMKHRNCRICGKILSPKKIHQCNEQSLRRFRLEKKITRLYYEGYTISQIAEKLGFGHTTIVKLFKRKGIRARWGGIHGRKITNPLDSTILAYVAGLLDGEGYITYVKSRSNPNDIRGICVGISNSDANIMDWLIETFNCGVIYLDRPKNPNQRICYKWEIRAIVDALIFLKSILPYVKIKKAKVKQAIDTLEQRIYKPKDLGERYSYVSMGVGIQRNGVVVGHMNLLPRKSLPLKSGTE